MARAGQPAVRLDEGHLGRSRRALTLFLDTSALAKRYVDEVGREEVQAAWRSAAVRAVAQVTHVEIARSLHAAPAALATALADLSDLETVRLGDVVVARARELVLGSRLRSLDAIQLASAEALQADDLVFATWDQRLWDAARERGHDLLPAQRP